MAGVSGNSGTIRVQIQRGATRFESPRARDLSRLPVCPSRPTTLVRARWFSRGRVEHGLPPYSQRPERERVPRLHES